MKRFIQLRQGLVAAAAALLLAAPVTAATVSPTKANGDFIAGTGIPADNFTIATSAGGEAVALKGRLRDTGQPLSQSGNIYYVPTGLAANNVSPAWSVDYQFTPRDTATTPPTVGTSDYWLTLDVDFDPAYGSATFKTLSGIVTTLTGGYQANPGSGAWSNNTTPYVVSESTHLGFNFWNFVPSFAPPAFNPNLPGEYEIRLTVSEIVRGGLIPLRGADIAGTDILVRAVPEPTSLGLAGIAVAVGAIIRRRVRRQA
jgi:hypothetical protein